MRNVLLVNELGGNLGHLLPLSELAKIYMGLDFRVVLASRTPAPEYLKTQNPKVEFVTLPATRPTVTRSGPEPCSYSEILLQSGFADIEFTAQHLSFWKHWFTQNPVDIAVFDFAPFALLAAQSFAFKKALFGIGFSVPPSASPMSAFFDNIDPDRLVRSDDALIKNINMAVQRNGDSAFAVLSGTHRASVSAVIGSNYSDCYAAHRADTVYLGALEPDAGGQPPPAISQEGNQPRAFAYLHSTFPYAQHILDWLSERAFITAYIGGKYNSKIVNQFRSSNDGIHFVSDQLLDIKACLDQSDFVVCHSGQSTVSSALKRRLPILAIPTHTEQRSTALLLEKQHLGKCVGPARNWQLLEKELGVGFQKLDEYKAHLSQLETAVVKPVSLKAFVMQTLTV